MSRVDTAPVPAQWWKWTITSLPSAQGSAFVQHLTPSVLATPGSWTELSAVKLPPKAQNKRSVTCALQEGCNSLWFSSHSVAQPCLCEPQTYVTQGNHSPNSREKHCKGAPQATLLLEENWHLLCTPGPAHTWQNQGMVLFTEQERGRVGHEPDHVFINKISRTFSTA